MAGVILKPQQRQPCLIVYILLRCYQSVHNSFGVPYQPSRGLYTVSRELCLDRTRILLPSISNLRNTTLGLLTRCPLLGGLLWLYIP